MALPEQAAYAASKFAVRGFSKLASRTEGSGVAVTVVHPAGVNTSIAERRAFPGITEEELRDAARGTVSCCDCPRRLPLKQSGGVERDKHVSSLGQMQRSSPFCAALSSVTEGAGEDGGGDQTIVDSINYHPGSTPSYDLAGETGTGIS